MMLRDSMVYDIIKYTQAATTVRLRFGNGSDTNATAMGD